MSLNLKQKVLLRNKPISWQKKLMFAVKKKADNLKIPSPFKNKIAADAK